MPITDMRIHASETGEELYHIRYVSSLTQSLGDAPTPTMELLKNVCAGPLSGAIVSAATLLVGCQKNYWAVTKKDQRGAVIHGYVMNASEYQFGQTGVVGVEVTKARVDTYVSISQLIFVFSQNSNILDLSGASVAICHSTSRLATCHCVVSRYILFNLTLRLSWIEPRQTLHGPQLWY